MKYIKRYIILSIIFLSVCFTANCGEVIKILAIGNSFSEDAIENYLYDLGKADDVTFIIGNMYIGGCSLETHWNNANSNAAAYSFRKIDQYGAKTTVANTSILTAIQNEEWDYISLQQVSQNSGMYDTYFPYLTDILNYVKSKVTNPDTKYLLHSTWAYAKNSDHSGFVNYDKNQLTMYEAIVDASKRAAETVGINIVVPSGTAIQNGRSSFIGDNFCRDGYHLDMGIGRYTAACTWYEKLTGKTVIGNSFIPQGVTASRAKIAQNAAHYAVANPLNITDMAGENPFPNPTTFTLKDPVNIDFGSTLSALPWNNISSPALGTFLYGLLDSKGNETPIKIEINDAFGNINLSGPSAGLNLPEWTLPKEVTSDSFWGNAGNTFEGKNEVTGGFLVSNLNPNMKYDFMMFSSRTATDNREISFKVEGNTDKTVYVNGSSNTTQVAKIEGISPKSDGTIVITLGAGPNNNNANKFFYINALQIAPNKESQLSMTQKMYFDFGPNDVTNGNITLSPDVNGNHWNNPVNAKIASATPLALVNSGGEETGYVFELTKNFSTNGIKTGGLLSPSEELLGDFAIATATQDFFFVEGAAGLTGEFKITNLDKNKAYKFYMFGSRTDANSRVALFTFNGLNTYSGTHQTSGANLGGTGYNANNSTIFSSDLVYPDANGEITIEVARQTGSYAHLNIMKIEEYESSLVKATAISLSGNNINLSGGVSTINIDIFPEGAVIPGIVWSVDNENVAWVDANGVLHPKSNGVVNVTATITYDDYELTDTYQVVVSNQLSQLYFSGTATENGDNISTATPMKMVTDLEGSVSNIFEIYTSLNETGTFNFYTTQDRETALVYGDNGVSGSLVQGGDPINSANAGPAFVTVNLNTNTYTVMPITEMSLVGSATPNGWNQASGIVVNYLSNGVWSATVDLNATAVSSDPSRFIFVANKSWSYSYKKVTGTEDKVSLSSHADQNGYAVEDIGSNMNGGTYIVTLNLQDYTYSIVCESVNDYKISMMGSSVANGQGATDMKGYAYMYGQLLQQRHAENEGRNWQMSGISVNGNNTSNLLARWNKDLVGDCSGYVIYGLSLGNEGIHENGQPSFDSYRDNMLLLIDKARQLNKYPVMTNSYTRADFTAGDYEYIKQMNLLIHEWDLPSINLLGAIDDGTGKWATGYQVPGDIYHPTTEGHQEFFYAFVPSLFDAIEAGKPLPTRITGTSYTFDSSEQKAHIEFTPENTVHSFTLSFDVKTSDTGTIASFDELSSSGAGKLEIDGTTNSVIYKSPLTGNIQASAVVNDNQWHRITLSHYYAQGRTLLYIDDTKVGELNEKLEPSTFKLNDDNNSSSLIDYRELFFYRSGMNIEEISALHAGRMLKSSLEIYAPLDGQTTRRSGNDLTNYAQSMNNTLELIINGETSIEENINSKMRIFPNPVSDILKISGLEGKGQYSCKVFSSNGQLVQTNIFDGSKGSIVVTDLQPSLYILEISDITTADKNIFRFVKK